MGLVKEQRRIKRLQIIYFNICSSNCGIRIMSHVCILAVLTILVLIVTALCIGCPDILYLTLTIFLQTFVSHKNVEHNLFFRVKNCKTGQ